MEIGAVFDVLDRLIRTFLIEKLEVKENLLLFSWLRVCVGVCSAAVLWVSWQSDGAVLYVVIPEGRSLRVKSLL